MVTSLSKAVITSDLTAVSLLLPPVFPPIQLSLSEPLRTRAKRQALTDDGDIIQQQIVEPQAAITLVTSPRMSFMLVSDPNELGAFQINEIAVLVVLSRLCSFLIFAEPKTDVSPDHVS